MISGIVFAALACVAACTKLVHCQSQRFMRLDAQSSERHRSCDEMPDNTLNRLHLFERRWLCSLLEAEEVANEDGLLFLIDELCPLLELLVRAKPCGNLQVGNRVRVPSMKDAVLAPRELAVVLEDWRPVCRVANATYPTKGLLVQANRIPCNFLQPYAAYGADFSAEVATEQVFGEADALEYLSASIAADG